MVWNGMKGFRLHGKHLTRSKIRGAFGWHDPEKIIAQRVCIRFNSSFLQNDLIWLYFQKNITSSTHIELTRPIFYQIGRKKPKNHPFWRLTFFGQPSKMPSRSLTTIMLKNMKAHSFSICGRLMENHKTTSQNKFPFSLIDNLQLSPAPDFFTVFRNFA